MTSFRRISIQFVLIFLSPWIVSAATAKTGAQSISVQDLGSCQKRSLNLSDFGGSSLTALISEPVDEVDQGRSDPEPNYVSVARKLGLTIGDDGKCPYSRKQLIHRQEARSEELVVKQHKMLDDIDAPFWGCVMLHDHLKRDNLKGCLPDPDQLYGLQLPKTKTARGTISYYHFIKKRYAYDLESTPDGKFLVTVRIHFKGPLAAVDENQKVLQEKLENAAKMWNADSPGGRIQFKFLSVAEDASPHFSVNINDKDGMIRYDKTWGLHEHVITIAHEIGHMMGLADEYKILRSLIFQGNETGDLGCNVKSLLCDFTRAYDTHLYPYYYYMILRRAACGE